MDNLDKLIKEYGKELADYFGVEPIEDIIIKTYDSYLELGNKYTEYTKTSPPSYLKNFTPRESAENRIFMIQPGVPNKLGQTRTVQQFKASLKHEMVHIYQRSFYRNNNIDTSKVPSWLKEGEAMLIAKQSPKDPGNISLDKIKNLESADEANYSIGHLLVSKILERSGRPGLLKLLKKVNNKADFYKELSKLFPELK